MGLIHEQGHYDEFHGFSTILEMRSLSFVVEIASVFKMPMAGCVGVRKVSSIDVSFFVQCFGVGETPSIMVLGT